MSIPQVFIFIWFVSSITFIVYWRKEVNAKKKLGVDYEEHRKISMAKRIIGIVCIGSFFLGGLTHTTEEKTAQKVRKQAQVEKQVEKNTHKDESELVKNEQDNAKPEQQEIIKKIEDKTTIEDVRNGTDDKVIGKCSVTRISPSEFTELREVLYLNWVKDKLTTGEWNYAFVVFSDKTGKGAAGNTGIMMMDG